jgi:ribosomal protein L23
MIGIYMNSIFELMPDKLAMTHKAYTLANSNKLVFVAQNVVSKFALFAFFNMMNVKVKKINSMNYKPEVIGFKNRKGMTKAFKKFVVTFDESESAMTVLENMMSLQYIASK